MLASGVEQTLRGQLLLALLEQRHERAHACRCETVDNELIVKAVLDVFDLRPGAIVRDLDLKRPIYRNTAAYGHFGRKPVSGVYKDNEKQQKVDFFTWEQTDRVKALLSAAR